jgi:formylglycine-generating enzyme required for sulfatase activity
MTEIDAPAPDRSRTAATLGPDLVDMIWFPGGTFRMGSNRHSAEESPVHCVAIDGFWIDRTPMANRQFRER